MAFTPSFCLERLFSDPGLRQTASEPRPDHHPSIPLVGRLQAAIAWDAAEEVAFECEPGTLTRSKLEVVRAIGVTRLSLGIENFNDDILQENGRAHPSHEIYSWFW